MRCINRSIKPLVILKGDLHDYFRTQFGISVTKFGL
jgi:hypothetical protein